MNQDDTKQADIEQLSTYDPSKLQATMPMNRARLVGLAKEFAGECAKAKQLPTPTQLRSLLEGAGVTNPLKVAPVFEAKFWQELSRLTGIAVKELRGKAEELDTQTNKETTDE